MNILLLASDAYGGQGGIAYYNRCLVEALADVAWVERITVMPRVVNHAPSTIPRKVVFEDSAAGHKIRYIAATAGRLFEPVDLVICGHVNLLPVGALISLLRQVPLVLQVHGIEVWRAPGRLLRACLPVVRQVWAVSTVTVERMALWAPRQCRDSRIIPNTIHAERYGVAPKRADLVQRYGLAGRKTLVTLARLDSRERYKGMDQVLESLPALVQQEPAVVYLIAGSGDDRQRLEAKAQQLGVAGHVVFAGYVPESDKADLMRLADAFVMPGSGEGFGIVYLEAMACGVPVLGSILDGSREALRDGELGTLVDPRDPTSVLEGILRALRAPRGVPAGLEHFAWPAFVARVAVAVQPFRRSQWKQSGSE